MIADENVVWSLRGKLLGQSVRERGRKDVVTVTGVIYIDPVGLVVQYGGEGRVVRGENLRNYEIVEPLVEVNTCEVPRA